jgi:hypothetical protein
MLPAPPPSFDTIPLETKLDALALLCPKSFELRSLQIPSVPFFALQTNQDQAVSHSAGATIIRKFSQEEIQANRRKTMEEVIKCTNTLIDLAIQTLEFAETIADFHPPPFHLGPLPQPIEPQPAFQILDDREETLKQEIREQLELRKQLRLTQGQPDLPIQPFELDTIAHSLSLRTYGEKFSQSQVKEMIRHLFPNTEFAELTQPMMRVGV